jgi:glycosyltransferase involved in cell wall biosynthesis
MKIAFITRSTLREVYGGDTVQIDETARQLRLLNVQVDILLTNEKIEYDGYDLFHFFNITRPADIIRHTRNLNKPYVISPILVDHSEYDRKYRSGVPGFLLRMLSPASAEYLKSIARWVLGKDSLGSKRYILLGQRKSTRLALRNASMLLPNSVSEFRRLQELYGTTTPYHIIPNGIDPEVFKTGLTPKNKNLVVCAARIEGRKNQLHLINALNNTSFRLVLAGDPAPNQLSYYKKCRESAMNNVEFAGKISQQQLAALYQQAAVHVLPSWFESCGLSSLEAAAMYCNIVITDKGFTRDYFGDHAFYCDPASPDSIREAVTAAANAEPPAELQKLILEKYTWKQAAIATLEAYKEVLQR